MVAFDAVRAIAVVRWGHTAGWLPEEAAWARAFDEARRLQAAYASWAELASAFVFGWRFWSGGWVGEVDPELARELAWLQDAPDSPWAALPWDTPLDP